MSNNRTLPWPALAVSCNGSAGATCAHSQRAKKMGSPQATALADSLASWRDYTLRSIVAAVGRTFKSSSKNGTFRRMCHHCVSFVTFQRNSCLVHAQNFFRRECALEYGNFINQSGEISSGHFGVVANAYGHGISGPIFGIVRALVGTFQAAVDIQVGPRRIRFRNRIRPRPDASGGRPRA